jgi:Fungal Zn(2)-Cys(6) binuclear cluster domain/Fungal specific transcription factor domain
MSNPQQPRGIKRVRARKACIPCSTRKRKCNGQTPCATCEGYGYDCSYLQNPRQQANLSCTHSPEDHNLVAWAPVTALSYGTSATTNLAVDSIPPPTTGVSFPDTRPEPQPPPPPPPLLLPPNVIHQEAKTSHSTIASVRYIGEYSLEAFPRFLGLQLQSDVTKLRDFGWNLGIRNVSIPHLDIPLICSFTTADVAKQYIRRFFSLQFPACGFLELRALTEGCDRHWAGFHQGLPFEVLVASLIGLCCIVAPATDPQLQPEVELMHHAETIITNPTVLSEPNIEVLAAMFLRLLYLRATSTPQICWMLSCETMHMAESLGLHKDSHDSTGGVKVINDPTDSWSLESKSCLFWMLCTSNRLLAYELGRTPVRLYGVTQRKFPFDPSDHRSEATLCRLGQLLPLDIEEVRCDSTHQFDLNHALEVIENTAADQPYLKLVAANVCFCLYRKILVSSNGESSHFTFGPRGSQQIVSISKDAVRAVHLLIQRGQAWWSMLSTLFQVACVLISLDSESLADLEFTFQTIQLLRDRYPGSHAEDALNALEKLTQALKMRKERHLGYLNWTERSRTPSSRQRQQQPNGTTATSVGGFPRPDTFANGIYNHPAMSSLRLTDWSDFDLDWMAVGETLTF